MVVTARDVLGLIHVRDREKDPDPDINSCSLFPPVEMDAWTSNNLVRGET